MQTLSEYMLRQFEKRMEKHLQSFADSTRRPVPAAELPKFIRSGFKKAANYGITDEADVQRFLEFAWQNGLEFDARPDMPWARQILDEKSTGGTQKMNRLEEYDLMVARKPAK
jgi:hypothetical protein